MKKWILAFLIISCTCLPAEAIFEAFKTVEAKKVASSDQSLISGQLNACTNGFGKARPEVSIRI